MALVLSDEVAASRRLRSDNDPFGLGGGVRFGHALLRRVDFSFAGRDVTAEVAYQGGGDYAVRVGDGGRTFSARGALERGDDGEGVGARTELVCAVDGVVSRQGVLVHEDRVRLFTADCGAMDFRLRLPKFVRAAGAAGAGGAGGASADAAVAPMPGTVEAVPVAAGDAVRKGDSLAVMIAMKMEYVLRAARDGEVERVAHGPGDAVKKGTPIVLLKKQQQE